MVNIRNKGCAQGGCSKQATFGVEGSNVATNCRHHAKDGKASVPFAPYVRNDCSKPRFSGANSSPCGHHAETSVNPAHLRPSLGGSKKAQARSDHAGHASEGHTAMECRRKRSTTTSGGRARGDVHDKFTTKRVRRGEEDVPMSSSAPKSETSQCTDGGAGWRGVKVETCLTG